MVIEELVNPEAPSSFQYETEKAERAATVRDETQGGFGKTSKDREAELFWSLSECLWVFTFVPLCGAVVVLSPSRRATRLLAGQVFTGFSRVRPSAQLFLTRCRVGALASLHRRQPVSTSPPPPHSTTLLLPNMMIYVGTSRTRLPPLAARVLALLQPGEHGLLAKETTPGHKCLYTAVVPDLPPSPRLPSCTARTTKTGNGSEC